MQALISFVQANWGAVALALYAILDVAVLASPGLQGNGLVHQLLLWLKPPPSA